MFRKAMALVCFIFLTAVCTATFGEGLSGEGYYLSGNVGVSMLEDADYEGPFNGTTGEGLDFAGMLEAKAEHSEGLLFGGAFGYDFGMFRTEVEVNYRENDFDDLKHVHFNDVTVNGVNIGNIDVGNSPASGEISALSCLFNGYLDYENSTSFTPYVGAGIGFAKLEVDGLRAENRKLADDSDTVFAYQAAVGVGYDVNQNVTLDAGYRYFATEDPEFDGFDGEYDSHNISFTVRYKFW